MKGFSSGRKGRTTTREGRAPDAGKQAKHAHMFIGASEATTHCLPQYPLHKWVVVSKFVLLLLQKMESCSWRLSIQAYDRGKVTRIALNQDFSNLTILGLVP